MANNALLHFLCVSAVFLKGLNSVIQTQRTVMAKLGEEAPLRCQLITPRDVLQVTWQKYLQDGKKIIATDNKYSGQRVEPEFSSRVVFKDSGLKNSSIVFREVTEQDEGCYTCLFNNSFSETTCLKLYELHEPVLHVRESNSSEEFVVSCSATGRPAPTVTLSVLHHKLHFSTHSYKNTNGTVTVNTEIVLRRNYDNSTQVECEVKVPFVPLKKDSVMIPAFQQSPPGLKVNADITLVIAPVTVVSVLVLLGLLLLCFLKRKQLNRNSTPLMQQQNEQEGLRQRTSTAEKTTDSREQALSQTPRCRKQLNL